MKLKIKKKSKRSQPSQKEIASSIRLESAILSEEINKAKELKLENQRKNKYLHESCLDELRRASIDDPKFYLPLKLPIIPESTDWRDLKSPLLIKKLSLWTRIKLFFCRSHLLIDPIYKQPEAQWMKYKTLDGVLYVVDEGVLK